MSDKNLIIQQLIDTMDKDVSAYADFYSSIKSPERRRIIRALKKIEPEIDKYKLLYSTFDLICYYCRFYNDYKNDRDKTVSRSAAKSAALEMEKFRAYKSKLEAFLNGPASESRSEHSSPSARASLTNTSTATPLMTCINKCYQEIRSSGGGGVHAYNGKTYKIHTGSRGGRYILIGKDKRRLYV